MATERPTFKELYEESVSKIDKIETRLSRLEKGYIVLMVMVASPKIGGPDPSQLVADTFNYLAVVFR